MAGVVSLKKSNQKKFVKNVKNIKKSIEEGIFSEDGIKKKKERGLIYVGHIPHGFYESEMRDYFKQFGTVSNVVVCKSRKSGNSKGFGYVEFSDTEVAKIAAETMNNYLMFSRRLIVKYIPPAKQNKRLFKGTYSTKIIPGKIQQRKSNRLKNSNNPQEVYLKKIDKKLKKLYKKTQGLKKLGVLHTFKLTNIPEEKLSLIIFKDPNSTDATLTSNKDKLENKTLASAKMVKIKKSVNLNDSTLIPKHTSPKMKIGKLLKNKKQGSAKTNLIKLAADKMLKSNHVIVTRSAMKKQLLKK